MIDVASAVGSSGMIRRREALAEAPRRIRGGNLTAIRGDDSYVAPDVDSYLSPRYYGTVCAFDISATTAAVTAETQQPITAGALSDESPRAREWRTIASPFVLIDVGNVYRAVDATFDGNLGKGGLHTEPDAQPSMNRRLGATVASRRTT